MSRFFSTACLLAFATGALALPSAAAAQQRGPGTETVLWAAGGAALVGAALLDGTIDRDVADGGGTRFEDVTRALNYGGRPQLALVALGATWAGGRLAGSPRTAQAAGHVAMALLAAGVVNGTVKVAVGRERPNETDDPTTFRPFNLENRWQSFPSGHATVAFSLAASISEEAREPWVTVATYSTATLVAWSRVYDDKHWASDAVAGALIGIGASRATLAFLHAREDGDGSAGDGVRVAILPNALVVSIAR
jgi:membrane-associated phospholipid phosphatase